MTICRTAPNGRAQTTPTPTPERYLETPSPSMSPAPSRPSTVLPARVTALRKNTSSSRRRSLPSSSTPKPEETGRSTRSGDSRTTRSRAATDSPISTNKRSASQEQKELLPNLKRRKTILNSLDLESPQKSSRQDQPSKPMATRANGTNGACGVSTEDALEMREVEATVVL